MNETDEPAINQAFAWNGIAWKVLGLFSLVICLGWLVWTQRQFRLWLGADHYIAAELEVTKFTPKPRDSSAQSWIDGVIRPGGEEVTARGGDIAHYQHGGPNDRWGHEPRAGELEGKRLPVLYWPHHAEAECWWHPPTVIAPGAIPSAAGIVLHIAICSAFLSVTSICFRRANRPLKAAIPG